MQILLVVESQFFLCLSQQYAYFIGYDHFGRSVFEFKKESPRRLQMTVKGKNEQFFLETIFASVTVQTAQLMFFLSLGKKSSLIVFEPVYKQFL